jgi:UDP-N-acetylmuramyl pentapeptide synthase
MLRPDARVAGLSERADPDLRAEDVRLDDDGKASFRWLDMDVALPVRGRHNVSNALLALGIAVEWDVDPVEAIAALSRVELPGMRMDVRHLGDMRVIVDCYNANPASMHAAGDLLESMPRGSGRVAVMGSMLELGAESAALHEESVRGMIARDIDLVVATGEFAPAVERVDAGGVDVIAEADPLRAWDRLEDRLRGDEVVLLKGSRGVALERLLPLLEEAFGVRRRPSAGGNRGRRDDAGGASAGFSSQTTRDGER